MSPKIDHIVVLMLENRSFDHMLGFLDHPDSSYPRIAGDAYNYDPQGNSIAAEDSASATIKVSPGHEHSEVMRQVMPNGVVNNQGFVLDYERLSAEKGHPGLGPEIMRCQRPANIPVLATLAKEFAVCTRWHSSVPGMTWPNRNYAHAATSDGEVDIKKRLYDDPTIFEELSKQNKDWRIFSDNDAFAQARVFRKLWFHNWEFRFQGFDKFLQLAELGNLPHYSFIEPDHLSYEGYSSSQHPMNNAYSDYDFVSGENLILKIFRGLRSNPNTWERSLFLITYDEHGGFFDRIPPPRDQKFSVKPFHRDKHGAEFKFDLLGIRVPAVVVSPYIDRGTICDTLFDHCSIVRTVRNVHIPHTEPFNKREQHSNDFSAILNRTSPRSLDEDIKFPVFDLPRAMSLPQIAMKANESDEHLEPDDFQESLVWLQEEVIAQKSHEAMIPNPIPHDESDWIPRVMRAQSNSPKAFQELNQRLVLLRLPNGDVIENPNKAEITENIQRDDDQKVWIEALPDHLLERDSGNTLRLRTTSGSYSIKSTTERAIRAFELVLDGNISELLELFDSAG